MKTVLSAIAAIAIATSATAANNNLPPCCSKPSDQQTWGPGAIHHHTDPGALEPHFPDTREGRAARFAWLEEQTVMREHRLDLAVDAVKLLGAMDAVKRDCHFMAAKDLMTDTYAPTQPTTAVDLDRKIGDAIKRCDAMFGASGY